MKNSRLLCLFLLLQYQVIIFAQLQIENIQVHAPFPFFFGETSNDPSFYQWESIDNTVQGVNINLVRPEIREIAIQQNNVKLAFNILHSGGFMIALDVNFDDAGWESLYEGSSIQSLPFFEPPASFQSTGSHNLKVRYALPGQGFLLREYVIHVVPACQGFFRDNTKSTDPAIFSTGNTLTLWDETNTPNAKAVLVSEGFDANNGNYSEFYRSRGDYLAGELASKDYKLYVLNYNLGNQSLRNNAAVLHSAIEFVSSQNGGEEITLIGISMGGVIGRYTLAKADEEGSPLPVSAFASFDGPQQGAVIDQEFQDFVKDKKNGDFPALDNDAAKELLIYNTFDPSGTQHTAFYDELNSLNGDGYPTSTPSINVAFSNMRPNPNINQKWAEVSIDIISNGDFYVKNQWADAGSFLPLSGTNIDPIPFPWPFNFFAPFGATVDVHRLSDPTFIPFVSAIDLVNGKSKACFSVDLDTNDPFFYLHDKVPNSIVDAFLNIIDIQNLSEIAANETFNFTNTIGNYLLENLDVYGNLHLNKNDGFSGSSQAPEAPNASIDYQLSTSPCTPVQIKVANNARLSMGENGNQNGHLILEEGSALIIESGALVEVKWGSKIEIRDGALLHVKPGATLRISQYSLLNLQSGSQFIIDPGAIVQLWDGPDPDGRATIKIAGDIILNGNFEFSGNGFFQFDASHHLSFSSNLDEFLLEGKGKDFRFIRLNTNTILDIGNRKLTLRNGKVEYAPNAKMKVTAEGEAFFTNVTLSGLPNSNGQTGLLAENTNKLWMHGCDFNNLSTGLWIEGDGDNFASIFGCNFNQCASGIAAFDLQLIGLVNSHFWGSGTYALALFDIPEAVFFGGSVQDYTAANSSSDESGAIILQNVQRFEMNDGAIVKNNGVGIVAPYGSRSNVFLTGQTRIEGNGIGINMVKGGIDQNDNDYGLVHMNCASLINNTEVGIRGEDVLLQIDAFENCLNCPFSEILVNELIGDFLIDICYVDRNIVEVPARGNYWDENLGPNTFQHRLNHIDFTSGCAAWGSNIDFDFADAQLLAPINCSPQGNSGSIDPGIKICVIDAEGNSFYVHQQYEQAYTDFKSESFATSSDKFAAIALIPDNIRNQSSGVCQHYIDVARVMTGIKGQSVGIERIIHTGLPRDTKNWAKDYLHLWSPDAVIQSKAILPNTTSLIAWPNPAKDQFIINPGLGKHQFTCTNLSGQVYFTTTKEGAISINTQTWKRGIYFIETQNSTTKERKNGKIIIH